MAIHILPVSEHAGSRRNLGEPATAFFAFDLDRESHELNLPSCLSSVAFVVAVS
jgi:hypothetical protein